MLHGAAMKEILSTSQSSIARYQHTTTIIPYQVFSIILQGNPFILPVLTLSDKQSGLFLGIWLIRSLTW